MSWGHKLLDKLIPSNCNSFKEIVSEGSVLYIFLTPKGVLPAILFLSPPKPASLQSGLYPY